MPHPKDKERELFESFCTKRWGGSSRDMFDVREDGEYVNGRVQFAWSSWQARASQPAAQAEQAFEREYKADPRDPAMAEELRHFTAGWNAAGHPPWCSGGCCNPEDAAPAQQGGGVYLVATGQEWEGQETYTRHEGSPPPLCDFEGPLYAALTTATAGQKEKGE
jgi:hypothetical protein